MTLTIAQVTEDYDWRKAFEYAGPPLDSEYYADGTPHVARVRDEPESTSVAEFTPADLSDILLYEVGEHDGANWKMLGRLKDGRYFYLSAGCDYTGWDCQAGGCVIVSMDLERLINLGIPENEYLDLKENK